MIVVSPGQGSVELAAPAQTILSQWFTWMLLFRFHGPLPQRLSLDPLHCILIVWIDYGVCGDLRVSVSPRAGGNGEGLEQDRGTFGAGSYFEQSGAENAIAALVNTDRVQRLGKAAQVIVDECVVVGLNFDVQIDTTMYTAVDAASTSLSEQIGLSVDNGEAAIPRAAVLVSGRDEL